jgi:hypothetical protein
LLPLINRFEGSQGLKELARPVLETSQWFH